MKKNKILIVDDEENLVEMLAARLSHAGYNVETAFNGREGLGATINALHNNDPFSLILLDIMLPDINGIGIVEIIREEEKLRGINQDKNVLIVMLTAYDKPWMEPSEILGSDDYILKPFNEEELLKLIESKLSAREKP